MEKKINKFMKRTTIGSVIRGMCYGFAALLFAASCANDDVAQNEKQKKDNTPAGTTVFTGTSLPDATTRTAILNHTKGAGASVSWSSTDKIWVKDDANTWQQSTTTTIPSAANPSFAKFALSGTYTGTSHDVLYTNIPVSGTQPKVEIKAAQTQSAPNNFDHAGESGDFGIATATKSDNNYVFTLSHKAAYLCFIPRSANTLVHRSKLIKIEISSEDDIAGTYNIATNGSLTLASGGSKTITLTTGSGFDVTNATDDMNKNASYVVIAPGTHKLRVRYWLENNADGLRSMAGTLGPIEGAITKYVTVNCTAGSIQDVTANLNPIDCDATNFYFWDAKQNCWWQHEWNTTDSWQPTLTDHSNSSKYPTSADADRWYNTGGSIGTRYDAEHSSKECPNVNEAMWYYGKGDPHFDEDELWSIMGHLCKGGVWVKKKAKIAQDNGTTTTAMRNAYNGVDYRTGSSSTPGSPLVLSSSLPDISEIGNYFYLPLQGYYDGSSAFTVPGWYVYFWTSSSYDASQAYVFELGNGYIEVATHSKFEGILNVKFE